MTLFERDKRLFNIAMKVSHSCNVSMIIMINGKRERPAMIDGGCVYRCIGNQPSHLFCDYLSTILQSQYLDNSSFNGQDIF